jgi:hypothetical protein
MTEPLSPEDTLEIVMESDTVKEITSQSRAAAAAAQAAKADRSSSTDIMQAPQFPPAAAPEAAATTGTGKKLATGLGVVVFSSDNEVIDTVQKAVRGRLPVYNVGNIVHVIKIIDGTPRRARDRRLRTRRRSSR